MLKMYSQCRYVIIMFDHCVPSIALYWNNNVSPAYCIDFAGERERGRKQRNFVSKNAIHLVQNLSFFEMKQVE